MFRIRIALLLAGCAALALPGVVAGHHHPAHDEARCQGTTVDQQHEVCGQIGVSLAEGASIDEVIAESAPEARVIQESPPSYLLEVPVGEEQAYLEQLRANADVESASFVQLGYISEPAVAPTTAPVAPIATSPPVTVIPDTAVGAPAAGSSFAAVVLVAGVALVMLLASRHVLSVRRCSR